MFDSSLISAIVILLILHAFGDFVFQGISLERLKLKRLPYLLEHVLIYTVFFMVVSPFTLGLTVTQGLAFSLVNGFLHLAIDFFTGKLKLKYLGVDSLKYDMAFGFDHTFHLILLIYTYFKMFPNAHLNLPF